MTEEMNTTLMEFPCQFPIKIIGNKTPTIEDEILNIVMRHFSTFDPKNMLFKESAKGNYLATTVTVYAENQAMLDEFYKEISSHPEIKMVL